MRQRADERVKPFHPGRTDAAREAQLVAAAFERDAGLASYLVDVHRRQSIELDDHFVVDGGYRLHIGLACSQAQAGQVDQVLGRFGQRLAHQACA